MFILSIGGGQGVWGMDKNHFTSHQITLTLNSYRSLSWQLTNQSNLQNMWQKGAIPHPNHDEKAHPKLSLTPARGS